MNSYYQVFEREFAYKLTQTQKDDLCYYAGQIPYLLSNFGWQICERLKSGISIDINEIYDTSLNEVVISYYMDVLRLLKEDELLQTAIQAVVGPQPNIALKKNEITQLIDIGYIYPIEHNRYKPLSEKFYEILYLQEVEDDTWKSLRDLEKALKRLVNDKLEKLFDPLPGETYYDALWRYVTDMNCNRKDKYRHYMQTAAEITGRDDISLLTVLTFGDLRQLISDKYMEFRDVFPGVTKSQWNDRMKLCTAARDMRAHCNEGLLSDEYVAQVGNYCVEFIRQIGCVNA